MYKNDQQQNNFKKAHRKGFHQLKSVRLTDTEKRTLFARVSARINMPAHIPPKIMWNSWSWFHYRWAYTAMAVIIGIVGSTSVAFAAQGSLPGDILYPIKTQIIEPIQESLTFSAIGKAVLAFNLANERLTEGETLATKGMLSVSAQNELSRSLSDQTKRLYAALSAIVATNPNQAAAISDNFQKNMEHHAKILELLASTTPNANVVFNVNHKTNTESNTHKTDTVSNATLSTTTTFSKPDHQKNEYSNKNKQTISPIITQILPVDVSTSTSPVNNSVSYVNAHSEQNNKSTNNKPIDNQSVQNLITSIHQSEATVNMVGTVNIGQIFHENGNSKNH